MKANINQVTIGTRLQVEKHPEYGTWAVCDIYLFDNTRIVTVRGESGCVDFSGHNWITI